MHTGEVQYDKQQDKADSVNANYAQPAWRAGGKYRLARQLGAAPGTGGQVSLRYSDAGRKWSCPKA